MTVVRGVSALIAILLLVGVAPVVLVVSWPRIDMDEGWAILLRSDDGTLLSAMVVIVGWIAWVAFSWSLVSELVGAFTAGNIRLLPRGFSAPRAVAAALIGAVFALAAVRGSAVADDDEPSVAAAPHEASPPTVDDQPVAQSTRLPESDESHLMYTVLPGDDLWSLAQTHLGDGARWSALVEANPGLDPQASLVAGSTLRIPLGEDETSLATRTVTVRKGDSLWLIAERALGDPERWTEIHALNSDLVSDPDEIDAGWVLRLPADTVTAPSAVPAVPRQAQPDTGAVPSPDTGADTNREMSYQAPSSSTDADTVVAGESSADPVWLILGGFGPLLAAGVCGALAVSRDMQHWSRPSGRRFVHPSPPSQHVQAALVAKADTPRLGLLEAALRYVDEHCRVFGHDIPPLVSLVVEPGSVTFGFDAPPRFVPTGFVLEGEGFVLTEQARAGLDEPTGSHPYPALVTLGDTEDETTHLANLASIPLLGVTGGPEPVSAVVSAWVTELTTAPWTEGLQLCMTESLVERLRLDRDQALVAAPADLVAELEHMTQARREALPGLADIHPATVFVFDQPLSDDLADRVAVTAREEVGICVITAHRNGPVTWELTGDDCLVGSLEPGGPALRVQHMPDELVSAIAELRAVADSTEYTPAPWWDHSDSGPSDSSTSAVEPHQGISPRQEPSVHKTDDGPSHPLLTLLGPIELTGAAGAPPTRGLRTAMEYCGWLLEHPGSTAPAMASSLLVAESSRRSTVSRLRQWLGKDTEGELYLPEAYSGRIWLHPGVSSDWQQLQILIAPGINRTSSKTLETALGMVNGAVLADAAPGQWGWAEELRLDMMATIRDIALELTEHALTDGAVDLARWATARALTVAPEDERLLCARIRTERRAGNHREVERLALKTTAHARRLGVDLNFDTVALLQEVMEGRVRARTVMN